MIDEYSERPREMPCVHDQQAVEALGPNGPNEPLRDPIRLWDLNRCTNDSRALGLKDGVETARELAIVIANEHADRVCPFGERPCEVPRLLCDPFAVGMRRAASDVHAATADFDKEQDIQPLEPNGVDGEEIHSNDAFRLRSQELPPRKPLALAGRTELFVAEDFLDGRR